MYSFQANTGKRKSKRTIRLLMVIIFILTIALASVSFVYFRSRGESDTTSEALMARAISEAGNAQTAVYRLTQSSGTSTMTLLSTVRSHIYALQCINTLAANIYGPGTVIADTQLLADCIAIITDCETKMQAGGVLTGSFTTLRDNIDLLVTSYTPAVQ